MFSVNDTERSKSAAKQQGFPQNAGNFGTRHLREISFPRGSRQTVGFFRETRVLVEFHHRGAEIAALFHGIRGQA